MEKNLLYITILSITLISVIISIISLRYAITIRKYLKKFIIISKKISKKEFHIRLDTNAKGELGELSKNFNEMIEIMHSTILEVENSHLQKESILKSISHGILAVDINSNIILINERAKKMLKCEKYAKIEGKSINLAIKEKIILKAIIPFIASKHSVVKEIKLPNDDVYTINIDPIYLHNVNDRIIIGSIINIKNITKRVMLENMRSDFVANVSHELKTPITSISGFVETLKLNEDLDKETRNRFLSIIESESNRLKRLIDDILLLSFIENKESVLFEEVNIYDVFIEVYDMTSYLAKNKNITVTYNINDEKINFITNRHYIKQIFINIIENAIKYTPKDKYIYIKIENFDKYFIFSVRDEGIGIPDEDLDRIFERFYRVDKARSREIGGTGLGLAITKHIVKNIGGSIKVNSELGVGSEFIIKIPKK